MNYKAEYRKYKIAKFFNKPIDEEFEQLYVWVKENLLDLKKFKSDQSDFIYYGLSENDIKFCIDGGYIRLDFHSIWKSTGLKYGLGYLEIKDRLKDILESYYGFELTNIHYDKNFTDYFINGFLTEL